LRIPEYQAGNLLQNQRYRGVRVIAYKAWYLQKNFIFQNRTLCLCESGLSTPESMANNERVETMKIKKAAVLPAAIKKRTTPQTLPKGQTGVKP